MVRFADSNVSQRSVATYAMCGRIFNIHLTTNLPRNLPVNFFLNRLRFDRIVTTSLWRRGPTFLAYPAYSIVVRRLRKQQAQENLARSRGFWKVLSQQLVGWSRV